MAGPTTIPSEPTAVQIAIALALSALGNTSAMIESDPGPRVLAMTGLAAAALHELVGRPGVGILMAVGAFGRVEAEPSHGCLRCQVFRVLRQLRERSQLGRGCLEVTAVAGDREMRSAQGVVRGLMMIG